MASCNTQCGCGNGSCSCGNSGSRNCVGALGCIRRGRNFPFYTGPCPPAPCTDRCGSCNTNACSCRTRAGVTSSGCDSCDSCGSCGCNACHGCDSCVGCNFCSCSPGASRSRSACGCGSRDECCASDCGCDSCDGCDSCGCNSCSGCSRLACGCGSRDECCASDCGCDSCDSCDSCGCSSCSGCSRSACGYGSRDECCTSDCGCDSCGGCNFCSCSAGRSRSACGCGSCDECCASDCGCNCCDSCNCACNGCNTCGDSCGCRGYSRCRSCGVLTGSCSNLGHGVFAAHGPFNLSEGSTIPLAVRSSCDKCYTGSYGSITIRHDGVYYAAITVDVPADNAVDTAIRLELDNQRLTPPEIAVNTRDDGSASNYAGHTVFHARAGSQLKLTTAENMCISDTTARPVFTLTLVRL